MTGWPTKSLLALGMAALVATGAAASGTRPLVAVQGLGNSLADPELLVLDIRDTRAFGAGHIPAAVNAVYPGIVRAGDWTILAVDDLVANFSALGISAEAHVVVVPAGEDSTEFGGASSVYWALRYLGHDGVAVLDGGMSAWLAESNLPLETGVTAPPAAAFMATPRPGIRATTDDVLAALGDGETIILDARPPEQYRGDAKSPLVSRAGRIPGALNLPHTEVFDAAAHRPKPADAIRALLPPALVDAGAPIIVYCNTGHWSSIVWFALSDVLGLEDVRLYDGSMKAWTEDPDRPVATGSP
jgi:thiosulfate/3-mercaptopyruvate sulfurtransferase